MKIKNRINKIKSWINRQIDAQNIANASWTKSKTIASLVQQVLRLKEEKKFIANDFNVNGVMLPMVLAHFHAIPRLIAEINKHNGSFDLWDKDRQKIEEYKNIELKPSRRYGGG